ncbi:MAG: peptidase T [Vicinamibacterales bacterium]
MSSTRPASESVVDRFLRYVRINTESSEEKAAVPSTPGQWDLARLLARELSALGAADVRLSDSCMVYARLPATSPAHAALPCVGLLAHMDTAPAVTGAGVRPIVHRNYSGDDIVLPGDSSQVIREAQHPALREMRGDDIITADGTTLLGSDDKAGVATIMTLVDLLQQNPHIAHGPIAVGFSADEEIGIGIDRFDVEAFGAAFGYTVDGEGLGQINHETWSARGATVTFRGVSAHPGTAKGVMVNAAYALAHFLSALPADMRPETTADRVGFIHPYAGSIDVETATLKLILRDFDRTELDAKEQLVRLLAAGAEAHVPGVRAHVDVVDQYRNMNEVLCDHADLVDLAMEAARRAGLQPYTRPIRGGTDGAKLTFRGLPCPNIFTGGHNFHSKLEFNSRRGLEKTTETLMHLVQVVAERPPRV